MLVRITQSVADYGKLVHPDEVDSLVEDPEKDYYVSPFFYGEDALEYFNSNLQTNTYGKEYPSIKGYTGDVWTDSLYWDLDCEENPEIALDGATSLLDFLEELGLVESAEVYFSGNKGVHIFLRTENEFTPDETKRICYNMAKDAGLMEFTNSSGKPIFDTSVYNINRIFRINNTKHPKSGLYKVQISFKELYDLSLEEIQDLAVEVRNQEYADPVDAEFLKDKYKKKQKTNLQLLDNVVDMEKVKSKYKGFNPMDCPPDKRRCIYVLENGHFGPGERENATIRLVAYYHGLNWEQEQVFEKVHEALRLREHIYPDLNPWTEDDIHRAIETVYSDGWNGGMYSCSEDHFLASKCDLGQGPCCEDKRHKLKAVTIGGLIDQYKQYGAEALRDYPATGLNWIDAMVRFRPKNYSIINGANGSGKTSLMMQWMENLNKQEMYHMVFSADMANTSFFEKLGAKHTDYTQYEIESAFNAHTKNEEIQEEIINALRERYPYTILDFTSALTSKHIETSIRDLDSAGYKIQVAFIDYAGRIVGDSDSQYQNSTQIALEGNDISKRTNTHLCFISQIPREYGDHTKPIRSSRVSKDSGAWEENATIVINVWRPLGSGIDDNDNYMHMYIAKNRSGALGEHVYWWDGKTGSLRDLTESEYSAYASICEGEDLDEPPNPFKTTKSNTQRLANSKFAKRNEEPEKQDAREDNVSYNRESRSSRRNSRLSDRR